MTRRELKDAVVEAARQWVRVFDDCGWTPGSKHTDLIAVVRALDACPEPDLDDLNAAVAEAVEEWWMEDATPRMQGEKWARLITARNTRYDALKPKPRYRPATAVGFVYDAETGHNLTAGDVLALLNERKP